MLPANNQDVDNFITFGTINTFRYTNHRGETAMRRVIPLCIRFGDCKCDTEAKDQWLLEAYDCEKQQYRTFVLSKIHPR